MLMKEILRGERKQRGWTLLTSCPWSCVHVLSHWKKGKELSRKQRNKEMTAVLDWCVYSLPQGWKSGSERSSFSANGFTYRKRGRRQFKGWTEVLIYQTEPSRGYQDSWWLEDLHWTDSKSAGLAQPIADAVLGDLTGTCLHPSGGY